MPAPGKGADPQPIDERWLREWFEYGYELLCGYLARHARFAEWADTHPTPDDPALD